MDAIPEAGGPVPSSSTALPVRARDLKSTSLEHDPQAPGATATATGSATAWSKLVESEREARSREAAPPASRSKRGLAGLAPNGSSGAAPAARGRRGSADDVPVAVPVDVARAVVDLDAHVDAHVDADAGGSVSGSSRASSSRSLSAWRASWRRSRSRAGGRRGVQSQRAPAADGHALVSPRAHHHHDHHHHPAAASADPSGTPTTLTTHASWTGPLTETSVLDTAASARVTLHVRRNPHASPPEASVWMPHKWRSDPDRFTQFAQAASSFPKLSWREVFMGVRLVDDALSAGSAAAKRGSFALLCVASFRVAQRVCRDEPVPHFDPSYVDLTASTSLRRGRLLLDLMWMLLLDDAGAIARDKRRAQQALRRVEDEVWTSCPAAVRAPTVADFVQAMCPEHVDAVCRLAASFVVTVEAARTFPASVVAAAAVRVWMERDGGAALVADSDVMLGEDQVDPAGFAAAVAAVSLSMRACDVADVAEALPENLKA